MTPHEIIDKACADYSITKVVALFSGGHDSLTATYVASSHPAFIGTAHINTGIGVRETREYVYETCRQQGWELFEYHPPEGHTYRDIVLKHGFPGPGAHRYAYTSLKERCLRQLTKDFKEHRLEHIGLVSGVRSEESTRRMAHVDTIQKDGSRVFIAPIHDWSKMKCNEYITKEGLKRNEVVDMIHMSGECLCGAFARKGEFAHLQFFYPETAKISDLEDEVAAAGKPAVWGKPPGQHPKDQQLMDFMPLCVGCAKRVEEE